MKMARKTAYACTETEFTAARELVQDHGPIHAPARPADAFDYWWKTV